MFFAKFVLFTLLPVLPHVVIGSISIVQFLSLSRKSQHAKQWLTTTGRLLDSAIEEHPIRSYKVYFVKVNYEYRVNGILYLSQRMSFTDGLVGTNSRLEAEKKRLKYKPGSEVRVYYNPNKLEEAVLEPDPNRGIYWLLGVGGLFLLGGLTIGSAVLFGSLDKCGITPSSSQPRPGSPTWCNRMI
jgi:hypothetical protein